jgi:hypothetical protein
VLICHRKIEIAEPLEEFNETDRGRDC